MTLLAHQTEVRFPSIRNGGACVHRLPLVRASRESLAGFGEIVPEFASAKVKVTPWPLKGWRPMSPELTLIRRDLPCSPCRDRSCPYAVNRCMHEIEVEEVLAAARRSLGGKSHVVTGGTGR